MVASLHDDRRIRARAAIAAAAIQFALAYALVTGLAQDMAATAVARIELVSLPAGPAAEPAPPPPLPDEGDGAAEEAAPPAPSADPTQIAAPPAKIDIPRPVRVVAAPVAGTGADPDSGAALAGAGTGAGGAGSGSGAGGDGSGTGAGGGRKALRVGGALRDSDYPEAAARVRAAGTVYVRFTVDPSGAVRDCEVTGSSGYGELDRLTCRLVERRFRYRPALDGADRAVAEIVGTSFTWGPRE